jgi:hypothetical protein
MNDNPEGPEHCTRFASQFLAFANPGNYYRQDSFTAFPAGDVRASAAVGLLHLSNQRSRDRSRLCNPGAARERSGRITRLPNHGWRLVFRIE